MEEQESDHMGGHREHKPSSVILTFPREDDRCQGNREVSC